MSIKTVKPNGGGDYTTLAAWEDFADGEATADQWAECYNDGGNLGNCVLFGWAATPDAVNYPRIYAAAGHAATGFSDGPLLSYSGSNASPKLDIQVDRVEVEGIRFSITQTSTNSQAIRAGVTGVNKVSLKSCVGLFVHSLSNNRAIDAFGTEINFINCLFKCNRNGVRISGPNSAYAVNLTNLAVDSTGSSSALTLFMSAGGASSVPTYNIKNSAFLSASGSAVAFTEDNPVSEVFNCDYNAASDGTATSVMGGTHNKDSIVPADAFNNYAGSDYTIKRAGVLYRGGVATANASSLNGVARHSPPDIGPYEKEFMPTLPLLGVC